MDTVFLISGGVVTVTGVADCQGSLSPPLPAVGEREVNSSEFDGYPVGSLVTPQSFPLLFKFEAKEPESGELF